jgi:hypothetical protein
VKYDAEMGSGAMIYIPSFIKTGSDIQVNKEDAQHGYLINLLLFFQIKESMLKTAVLPYSK